MNNDMLPIPVGTTIHINPEDVKWELNGGDLISRSALKKAITEATYNFEQIPIRVDKVQEIIDNAPAVNFMISPDYVTELQNRNKEFIKQLEKVERSQGEWIDLDTDESWYRFKCSNCSSLFPRGMFMNGYPYCPRCGAKMQHD